MRSRARRSRPRATLLTLKMEPDVVAEAERLAQAAGVTRDVYVSHAVRHYNRFHALTKTNHVRVIGGRRVASLFPVPQPPPSISRQVTRKSRRR